MVAGDKDWLLERSNIRRLSRGADDAAEDDNLPRQVRKEFQELESVLQRITRVLRQHDM